MLGSCELSFCPVLAYIFRVKRLVFPVVLLSVGACGGSGDPIPIDELAPRLTQALCTFEVRCGALPDQAACEQVFFFQQQLVADVKTGKVIYDGKAAAACLDLYRGLSCEISAQGSFIASHLQSCKETFKGTVSIGGACLMDEECLSQSCEKPACNSSIACCAGTCMAQIPAGGDCSSGGECADDLFCRYNGTDQVSTCIAPIADGQPCTDVDICVTGRRCNLVAGTRAGTCGVLPAHGQSCPDTSCDSLTDTCDPVSKTCVSRIAVGGDCSAAPSGCVAYASCDPATKTCLARKRAGEACAQAADCLSGLSCSGGVCVSPPDQPACP